ncbi:MAG TPA: DUF4365 domain-containing protein [Flavobacterium sp.]
MNLAEEHFNFPIRAIQHQSETSSGKIFSNTIPNNWVIRGVSERDYGVDYYIEIVDSTDRLTGRLTLIQVKARSGISWTQKNTYAVSDVSLSTSNYLANFAVPTFIFLVDTITEETFFINVKDYIRKNYIDYSKQKSFTYHADKTSLLSPTNRLELFTHAYERETIRSEFESNMLTFLNSLKPNCGFIRDHSNRDFHLGLEDEDIIITQAILNNYHVLMNFLGLSIELPTFIELKEQSKRTFGNEHHYELYEHDLSQISDKLESMTIQILNALKDFMDGENQYWMHVDSTLLNYIENIEVEYLFENY